jgi:hypothetical protein
MIILLKNILKEPQTCQFLLEVKKLQEVCTPLAVFLGEPLTKKSTKIGEPWAQLPILFLDSKNLGKGLV